MNSIHSEFSVKDTGWKKNHHEWFHVVYVNRPHEGFCWCVFLERSTLTNAVHPKYKRTLEDWLFGAHKFWLCDMIWESYNCHWLNIRTWHVLNDCADNSIVDMAETRVEWHNIIWPTHALNMSILLTACETWTPTEELQSKMQAVEMKYYTGKTHTMDFTSAPCNQQRGLQKNIKHSWRPWIFPDLSNEREVEVAWISVEMR